MREQIEQRKKVLVDEFNKLQKRGKEIETEAQKLQDRMKELAQEQQRINAQLIEKRGRYQELESLDGEGNKPRLKQTLDHLPKKK